MTPNYYGLLVSILGDTPANPNPSPPLYWLLVLGLVLFLIFRESD